MLLFGKSFPGSAVGNRTDIGDPAEKFLGTETVEIVDQTVVTVYFQLVGRKRYRHETVEFFRAVVMRRGFPPLSAHFCSRSGAMMSVGDVELGKAGKEFLQPDDIGVVSDGPQAVAHSGTVVYVVFRSSSDPVITLFMIGRDRRIAAEEKENRLRVERCTASKWRMRSSSFSVRVTSWRLMTPFS